MYSSKKNIYVKFPVTLIFTMTFHSAVCFLSYERWFARCGIYRCIGQGEGRFVLSRRKENEKIENEGKRTNLRICSPVLDLSNSVRRNFLKDTQLSRQPGFLFLLQNQKFNLPYFLKMFVFASRADLDDGLVQRGSKSTTSYQQ